jgi:hypothetical protein
MRRIGFVLLTALTSVLVGGWSSAFEPTSFFFSDPTLPMATNVSVVRDSPLETLRDRPTATGNAYSFTMTLPKSTGKPFSRLSFSFTKPDRGNEIAVIPFNLRRTQAFVGSPTAKGAEIMIASTWIDETGTLWVEFDRSVTPSTTLTVVLTTKTALPKASVAYSIAAYPNTKPATPLFVGDGILTNESE